MRRFSWILLAVLAGGCGQNRVTTTTVGGEVVTVRQAYNNAHLVRLDGATLLVDAGLERDAEKLDAGLRAEGVDPSGIDLILVSHGHADHAGGAGWFRDTYGTPILAGAGDRDLLGSGVNDPLCPTDATARQRHAAAQAEEYAPFSPDIELGVGEELDLGDLGLSGRVVSLPGHTEGSLVLLTQGAAFVGDLIRGAIGGTGARTHFFMCDLPGNEADVSSLVEDLAPEANTFFVGHFGPLSREAVTTWLAER